MLFEQCAASSALSFRCSTFSASLKILNNKVLFFLRPSRITGISSRTKGLGTKTGWWVSIFGLDHGLIGVV